MDGESGPSVWVGDTTQGDLRPFISGGQSVSPAWRPDGLEIAFAFSKAGPFNLFVKPVDGGAGPAPLLASPWNQFPTSWAPDGSQLAFTEFQPLTGADIWVLDVETRTRKALVRTLFDETWARFSPDGRSIAYMSNESGRWEIYLRSASGRRIAHPRLDERRRVAVLVARRQDGLLQRQRPDHGVERQDRERRCRRRRRSACPAPMRWCLPAARTAGDRLLVRQAGAQPAGRAELRVVLEWFTELTKRISPVDSRSFTSSRSTIRASPPIGTSPIRISLLDLGLFVAEGRLVVRRLLDLQHWAIDSILLTQPAADALDRHAAETNAPVYVVESGR